MQALILSDDPAHQTNLSTALMSRGFHVINAMSNMTGLAAARRGAIDLLVMSERVEGLLSHSVALSAELHSPYVTTIMLTPRRDEDLEELYELLPSLYSILGDDMPVDLITKLALSGVTGASCSASSERFMMLSNGEVINVPADHLMEVTSPPEPAIA